MLNHLMVEVDGREVTNGPETYCDVKVCLVDSDTWIERHIKVTEEGIIIDLVLEGEVIGTASMTHEEMLATPGDDV